MNMAKVIGYVTVKQGNKIVFRGNNKFVDAFLKGLTSMILGSYIEVNGDHSGYSATYGVWAYQVTIHVGTDTSTATTPSTNGLVVENTTEPNSFDGSLFDGTDTGVWGVRYTATWNAGVITDTIGEIGLYMNPFTDTTLEWTYHYAGDNVTGSYPQALCARLSVADGDFSAYTPDASLPLTVQWDIKFTF